MRGGAADRYDLEAAIHALSPARGTSRRWRWTIRAAGGRTVKSGIAVGEPEAAEGAAECAMAELLAIELD